MMPTGCQTVRGILLVLYVHLIFATGAVGVGAAAETLSRLPSLEEALAMGQSRMAKGTTARGASLSEVLLEVKRNYDLILARREQLEISREVQGHFEKALTQAEKKFEEGDEEVSQSAIIRLKLGLTGTLNDIIRFQSDIALAQLHLEQYLGVTWAENVDLSGPIFRPVDFPFKTVQEYRSARPSAHRGGKGAAGPAGGYDLRAAMIEVNTARGRTILGRKSRKITRALLVAEVANYDFGIGNEGDLFEALIIYTRVLVGYYETVYDFNLAVHRFIKIDSKR
jgi:hypothetical protein